MGTERDMKGSKVTETWVQRSAKSQHGSKVTETWVQRSGDLNRRKIKMDSRVQWKFKKMGMANNGMHGLLSGCGLSSGCG